MYLLQKMYLVEKEGLRTTGLDPPWALGSMVDKGKLRSGTSRCGPHMGRNLADLATGANQLWTVGPETSPQR